MKNFGLILLGIFIGCLLMFVAVKVNVSNLMVKTYPSRYEFEETVSLITEQAYANNWEVLHTYDIGERLQNSSESAPYLKINVLSICQPEFSTIILGNEASRYIASIMPCRIAVYEDDSGNVFVSRMNIGLFSKLFNGTVKEILSMVANDDEKIVQDVIIRSK